MPDFIWRAADAGGKVMEGRLQASGPSAVMKQLRERGLTPVSVEDAVGPTFVAVGSETRALPRTERPPVAGRGPVVQADVLMFTSELAIMLRAGLALDNALRVLIDMSHKPSVAALLQSLLDDVKGGAPLSRALARNKELFGDFYINMVRSGEISGQLAAVLTRLVEHMERLRALRDSVISAAIYPAILLGVAVISVIAMLGFVVPQFEKLFSDMGDALPLATRLVMMMGQAFKAYGPIGGVVCAVAIWLLMRWMRGSVGREWWQAKALRLPILGSIVYKYQLTLFTRSWGTLLGNGVPMLTALQIATETVSNLVLRQRLSSVAPVVKDGGKVVNAVAATRIFEPLAINLIRVGEETGRISAMLLELADIMNREVETTIKRALTLVEPVLILVLGVLIASIIVSILLGILSINDLAV